MPRNALASLIVATLLACGAAVTPAEAVSITYTTPVNAKAPGDSNLAVNASAVFTTGTGTVDIVLSNLMVNLTSEAQALSDIKFTLSSGDTGKATLSSSETILRTVTGQATANVTDGVSIISTGWGLDPVTGAIHITDIGFSAPGRTLIGPGDAGGAYSNANSSITNTPHKKHIGGVLASDSRFQKPGVAIFHLLVPGVTSSTTILSATFSFNTTAGDDVVGCNECITTTTTNNTPLPATVLLLGGGLVLAGADRGVRRFLRRR